MDYTLPDRTVIRLFQPEYFVTSKLEAFLHRGKGEYRWSQDFNDLVYVLDSRPELVAEIRKANEDVRSYIQSHYTTFLQDKDLQEGISAVLPYGSSTGRIQYVRKQIEAVII